MFTRQAALRLVSVALLSATAAIVVFFMRVGEFTERFTSERARKLLKEMTALVPQTARVQRDDHQAAQPERGTRPWRLWVALMIIGLSVGMMTAIRLLSAFRVI